MSGLCSAICPALVAGLLVAACSGPVASALPSSRSGSIRGADLATKMRYQPGDTLPAIFGN